VAEQRLDVLHVGAAFHKMSRKCMPNHVRVHFAQSGAEPGDQNEPRDGCRLYMVMTYRANHWEPVTFCCESLHCFLSGDMAPQLG
jgi:hypothetical protein